MINVYIERWAFPFADAGPVMCGVTFADSAPPAPPPARGRPLDVPAVSSVDFDSMNAESSSVMTRARIYAALGDPTRLAITDTLTLGDASPGEIVARLGMASNLVAHHLNVLADAGLIERLRSDADRRHTYVRLRPQALAALAAPALVAPALAAPGRVLFVCTRNSARSQLAAALWSEHSPIPAASAGTQPAPRVHPRAVRTAKRHGLRLDPARTAYVDAVARAGDLVIAVCDHAHETLPADAGRLHWSVPDPVPAGTDEAFETAYRDIARRIESLTPALPTKEHRA
jgi:ArsR family transcriptional regulator, arsenate/arsenite/antimonite-responsive transcriptional repressor / arsenate reductase (thioredoxin)